MKNQDPNNFEYNLYVCWRGILASLLIACAGCTYTRNAPLIESNITANGNTTTVPLVGQ